jgi:hypothetical protein
MQCTFHKKDARRPWRLQANKDDFTRIMANNHDKGRITTNKDDSRSGYAAVVDNRVCSSLIVLLLQPQAALSEGRRPAGGWLLGSRLHWVMQ